MSIMTDGMLTPGDRISRAASLLLTVRFVARDQHEITAHIGAIA